MAEPSAEKMFTKFDTNGDGFLNEEEINRNTRVLKKDWQKWDENKDKLISMSEWKAYFKDFCGTAASKKGRKAAEILRRQEGGD